MEEVHPDVYSSWVADSGMGEGTLGKKVAGNESTDAGPGGEDLELAISLSDNIYKSPRGVLVCCVLYMIRVRFKDNYNSDHDVCETKYIIIPCVRPWERDRADSIHHPKTRAVLVGTFVKRLCITYNINIGHESCTGARVHPPAGPLTCIVLVFTHQQDH